MAERHSVHNVSVEMSAHCQECSFAIEGTLTKPLAEMHFVDSGHRTKVTINESFIYSR